jgi:UDP-GlcNAc:undecaprenyl-phosphate/decaprenyl-phosphate GlcNAc-1-phosphate transferase
LTPGAGRLGERLGVVDRPSAGPLKIHHRTVPVLGGPVVAGGVLAASAIVGRWPEWPLVAAVLVALAAGLADDVRPLPAWVRVNLLAASGILVALVAPLEPLGAFGITGTVLLVLACANAVNLVDGQDGLAAGLGSICAVALAVIATVHGAGGSEMGFGLGGALAGFLVWNRPPARIFLGNGGAYAVGVLLATQAAGVAGTAGWRGLVGAGACLSVFAFEVVFTVARRIRSGAPLTTGDRGHAYDRLAERLGRGPTTVAFWGLGLVGAGLGGLIVGAPSWGGLAIVVMAAGGGLAGLATRHGIRRPGHQETYTGPGMSPPTRSGTIRGD